jgi:hypothetical protein
MEELLNHLNDYQEKPLTLSWLLSYCTEFTEFFWTFSIVLYSKKTRRFGNWICFRPQVNVGEKTPTQLGPLERANLNL